MAESPNVPKGWPIVAWCAAALVTMIVALLAIAGTDESGLRVVVRATARTSFVLFAAAFVASALHRVQRSAPSAWLLANRRYLGVSFAVSHALHLLALCVLAHWSARQFVANAGVLVTVVGGIGYVVLAAMTITSFDRTAAWLGPRRWKRLHTVGAYYLWMVFFLIYAPRAFTSLFYAPFALAVVGSPLLRWRARRSAPASGFAAVSAR